MCSEIAEAEQRTATRSMPSRIRIREQREQELALKLPAVHLHGDCRAGVGTQELRPTGCARDCGNLKLSASSSWPSIKARIRIARFSANCASSSGSAYELEQKRQEQKTLDDLFLARRKAAQLGTPCLVTIGKACPVHTSTAFSPQALIGTFFPSL